MNVYLALPIKSPLASSSRSVFRGPGGGTLDTRHSQNKQKIYSNISSPAKEKGTDTDLCQAPRSWDWKHLLYVICNITDKNFPTIPGRL